MKLAEALSIRADLQKKVAQLKERIKEIAKTIPTVMVRIGNGCVTRRLFLTQRHKLIWTLFETKFWSIKLN